MAWFPGAIRKEVTRFNPGGDRARLRIKGRGICDHVAASEAASLFNYFNEPGNPCSHFYVRRSGIVEQYVDTDWVAPANLEGNPTLLSIETQGGATELTVDIEPWEPAALDALIQLHIWLQKIDGFPIQEMPNSLSTSKGVGYHRLGIDPWRVLGGELWSRSTGKLCPGLEKIRQIRTVIIPSMKQGDIMALTDDEIEKIAQRTAAVLLTKTVTTPDNQTKSVQGALGEGSYANDAYAKAQNIEAKLTEMATLPGLTKADLQAACEAAVRAVLGTLDSA